MALTSASSRPLNGTGGPGQRRPGQRRSRKGSAPKKRRTDPARTRLGLATLLVLVGSFMPWIDTAVGSISGARGAGLWTFYAAMLGLAGALVPKLTWAAAQAALLSVIAISLPVWQMAHLYSLVGTAGWRPGPGIVFVLGGGVLAGSCAYQFFQRSSGVLPD